MKNNSVVESLKKLLADSYALYLKTQNYDQEERTLTELPPSMAEPCNNKNYDSSYSHSENMGSRSSSKNRLNIEIVESSSNFHVLRWTFYVMQNK